MECSNISLNDTSPTIGQARITINNPYPPLPQIHLLDATIDVLLAQQTDLLAYVRRLEDRISVLERRTWWSMLKSQVQIWYSNLLT